MAAAPALDRLFRTRGAPQRRVARRLLASGLPWPEWMARFRSELASHPARSARAVAALEAEAREGSDPQTAAKLAALHGVALQTTGAPAEAASALLRAHHGLQQSGDDAHAMNALILAVDALGHAGDTEEALALAARARTRMRGPRHAKARALLDANHANVLRLAGRMGEAAKRATKAAKALDGMGDPVNGALAHMNAGVCLLGAGDLVSARTALKRAQRVFDDAGHVAHARVTRYNLACLDVREGRLGPAVRTLDELAREQDAAGQPREAALCRMDLADALRRAGDKRSALAEATRAAQAFDKLGANAEAIEAWWMAARAAARPADAVRHLERAQRAASAHGRAEFEHRTALMLHERELAAGAPPSLAEIATLRTKATRLGLTDVAAEATLLAATIDLEGRQIARARRRLEALLADRAGPPHAREAATALLAEAERAQGEGGKAIVRLRRLTKRLDATRAGLPGPWLRASFLFERLDPYLTLVDALLARGRKRDRAEAEETLDALASRRFLQGEAPRGMSRKVRALRRELERLYDKLAEGAGPARGRGPAQIHEALAGIRDLERQIAELWRSAERREAEARRQARSAEGDVDESIALVHMWADRSDVRALVRTGGDVLDAGRLASRDELDKRARELAFHGHRVRLADGDTARRVFERALHSLADTLLAPLPLPEGARMRLVLDGRLPDLPFELLPVGGRPLAAALDFARVPAARLLLDTRPAGSGTAVIASGGEDLPGIVRETAHIGRDAQLHTGKAATKGAVCESLGTREIVHLAMHGIAAPEAPAVGGVKLADGWFSAADVPSRVAADLVILAACQTGAPPGEAGRAWGALPQRLLQAGARWVLWTSANVDDETTADLMSALHPVSDMRRVSLSFGGALERVIARQGTAARLVPFRLSGGRA